MLLLSVPIDVKESRSATTEPEMLDGIDCLLTIATNLADDG